MACQLDPSILLLVKLQSEGRQCLNKLPHLLPRLSWKEEKVSYTISLHMHPHSHKFTHTYNVHVYVYVYTCTLYAYTFTWIYTCIYITHPYT